MFCGIDFGTSNSTVGLADAEGPRLIALEGDAVTLPSAVFWESDGCPARFGRAAMSAYLEGEEGRLMRGLKSTLGSGLINERTAVGGRAISFKDVLAKFIGHLRAAQEKAAPDLDRVVLGRPVHFVDDDPAGDAAAEATLAEIAKAAGWKHVEFEYEPVAAALDYEQRLNHEQLVLIVDIGGGTSDVSIVRLGPERAQKGDRAEDILANDGIRVGGTDFDRLLSLAEAMPHLGYLAETKKGGVMPRHYWQDMATWHRINTLYVPRVASDLKALRLEAQRPELIERMMKLVEDRSGHALGMRVEAVKIELSSLDAARLNLRDIADAPNPMVRREGLEFALEQPMSRISALIYAVLDAAGVKASHISTVFVTGGSSGLPLLQAQVRKLLPEATMASGDMLGSVGTGLALAARQRFA